MGGDRAEVAMGDTEQLRQLVELLESGALTEAEFSAAKRRLLGLDDEDVPDGGAQPGQLGDSTPDALRPPGEGGADPPTDDGSSVSNNPTEGPAAGWYADPSNEHAERYWDGEHWTDHVSPAETQATASMTDAELLPPSGDWGSGAPPPPSPPASVGASGTSPESSSTARAAIDDRYLWAIVAVPVLVGIVEMVVGFNPGLTTILIIAAIGANTGLALLDIRANQELSEDGSTGLLALLAALLMPVYVFKRQRTLGRSLAPFWTYILAFVAVIALQVVTGATNFIDAGIVESEMESWGRSTFGVRVDVDCPGDQPARAGHRFVCEMSDGQDTVGVRVEVLNSDGDIEWEVLG